MKKLIFMLLFATAIYVVSCGESSTEPGPAPIDYGNITTIDYGDHVQPLLDEYAGILAANNIMPPGLQMDSWANLIKGWERGEAVIPFDANNSLLVELTQKLDNSNELTDVKIAFLERWINEGAKNDNDEVPYANSTNLLYVCSQGEGLVNVIDVDAQVVIRNIDLTAEGFGFPASAKPHHVEIARDKQHIFVSMIDAQVNTVAKISTSTYELVDQITTDIPALMAHHPLEDVLYISRFMLNNSTTSIFAINSDTMEPLDTGNDGNIILPPGLTVPHAMAMSADGNYAYTASFVEDQFLVVNHNTKEFEEAIPLGAGKQPLQGSVSDDDSKVYLSCFGTGEIVVVDVSDPTNRFVSGTVTLGGRPWHSVFNDDGTELYVGNLMMNNFAVIDVATLTPTPYGAGDGSDGLSQPHGIAISPDGKYVFVSGRNTTGAYVPYYDFGDNSIIGTVTVIDTETNEIAKVIEIENFGSGMRMLNEN